MKKIIISILVLILTITNIYAQKEIVGVWYNTLKTGKVEITQKNDKFYGKIIWLKEP